MCYSVRAGTNRLIIISCGTRESNGPKLIQVMLHGICNAMHTILSIIFFFSNGSFVAAFYFGLSMLEVHHILTTAYFYCCCCCIRFFLCSHIFLCRINKKKSVHIDRARSHHMTGICIDRPSKLRTGELSISLTIISCPSHFIKSDKKIP